MYRRKDIRYSIARCRKEGEHPPENMEIFTCCKYNYFSKFILKKW